MSLYLGFDTSNYTTSAALYDSISGKMYSCKQLLPVKEGQAGLRQSDAVFHHTVQLPVIIERLCAEYGGSFSADAVGVSFRPRNVEGSYMPCFLCGEGIARAIAATSGKPIFRTSHQVGHILAALFSADKLDITDRRFIAFHVSGGTTDCLLCEPDENELIKITEISSSLDLKAGQLVDRAGLMLGLAFPCGKELERLSEGADKGFKVKAVIRNGCCCLSGFENKASQLSEQGESKENIAAYVLSAVYSTVFEMTKFAKEKYGDLPVIFAGGVMSNKFIRRKLMENLGGELYFAEPEYSCDNAAGIALYAYYMNERRS